MADGMEAGGPRRGLRTAPPPRRCSRFLEASRRDRKAGLPPGPRRHHPSGTFAKGAQKQTALRFQQICKSAFLTASYLLSTRPPNSVLNHSKVISWVSNYTTSCVIYRDKYNDRHVRATLQVLSVCARRTELSKSIPKSFPTYSPPELVQLLPLSPA